MNQNVEDPRQPTHLETFVQNCELNDIFFESFDARLLRLGGPHGVAYQVSSSYACQEGKLLVRFDIHCSLRGDPAERQNQQPDKGDDNLDAGEDGRESLADINVVLVCDFAVSGRQDTPPDDLLEEFAGSVAYPLIFPYVREALSSMISRLGFPITTFGLLRPDKTMPSTLYGRRWST